MSRVSASWEALQAGMWTLTPACLNDDRFTDDTTAAADLAPICDVCPILALCAEYSTAARPQGGIWAGKRFTTRSKGQL